MTSKVEYTIPTPVLNEADKCFIIRAKMREVQLVAEKLKARMEA